MVCLIPNTEFRIIDNWYVSGLRGTGSKDVVAEDVFVPQHRTLLYNDAGDANTPGRHVHPDDPNYKVPLQSIFAYTLASPIVGMAVMCLATVFFFVCLGVLILRVKRPGAPRPFRVPGGVFTAGLGVVGTLFFLAVAVYEPYANSDGFPLEWTLFIGGVLLGLFFWLIAGKVRTGVTEKDRRRLILGGD